MTAPRHVAVFDIGKTDARLAPAELETLAGMAGMTRPDPELPGPHGPHADLDRSRRACAGNPGASLSR